MSNGQMDGWMDGWVSFFPTSEMNRSNRMVVGLRGVFEFLNDVVVMILGGNCVQTSTPSLSCFHVH